MDSCMTCKFWSRFENGSGVCRRYPPTIQYELLRSEGAADCEIGFQPTTMPDDWCGEYERDTRVNQLAG